MKLYEYMAFPDDAGYGTVRSCMLGGKVVKSNLSSRRFFQFLDGTLICLCGKLLIFDEWTARYPCSHALSAQRHGTTACDLGYEVTREAAKRMFERIRFDHPKRAGWDQRRAWAHRVLSSGYNFHFTNEKIAELYLGSTWWIQASEASRALGEDCA